MTMAYVPVTGYCPACGKAELQLRKADGVILCTASPCPNPAAAHAVLADPEIHHVVRFDDQGWFNVKHPLRERVDSELLDCAVHEAVVDAIENGMIPQDSYRLKQDGDQWEWERL